MSVEYEEEREIKDNSYIFVSNGVPFTKLGKTLGRASFENKIKSCVLYMSILKYLLDV